MRSEFIITGISKETKQTVFLVEDNASGGYLFFSDDFDSARKFSSLESCRKYSNCSYSMIKNKIEKDSLKIQEVICNLREIESKNML